MKVSQPHERQLSNVPVSPCPQQILSPERHLALRTRVQKELKPESPKMEGTDAVIMVVAISVACCALAGAAFTLKTAVAHFSYDLEGIRINCCS